MEIVTFTPATAVNPYLADMETLRDATDANTDKNLIVSGRFVVKNAEAIKHKKLIADAANAIDKTASFGKRTKVEALETTFIVVLTAKHKARRNAEREHAAKTDDNTVSIHDIIDEVSAKFIADRENEAIAAAPKTAPKPRSKAPASK
jgi:hypothetical protein